MILQDTVLDSLSAPNRQALQTAFVPFVAHWQVFYNNINRRRLTEGTGTVDCELSPLHLQLRAFFGSLSSSSFHRHERCPECGRGIVSSPTLSALDKVRFGEYFWFGKMRTQP